MSKKPETVEGWAVKIAAKVMQAAGLCRYDDVSKCQRLNSEPFVCDLCLERWLLAKVRRELRGTALSRELRQVRSRGRRAGDGE